MSNQGVEESVNGGNQSWLEKEMHPYFFVSMKDEPEAIDILRREMGTLRHNRRLILADREKSFIQAMANVPGSLYDSIGRVREREISYAMIAHSESPMPGMQQTLEIQRLEFDRKSNHEVLNGKGNEVPADIRERIYSDFIREYPASPTEDFDRLLRIIWLNNESYVRISPPARVAQILNLYQMGNQGGGLHLDVEPMETGGESRVLFAVANPPQKDFLLQVMEVFNRLGIAVNRAYCLTISNGTHPYFLGTFYVRPRGGSQLEKNSDSFVRLQGELYTTQILNVSSPTYREFVTRDVISGEDAALINAFTAFCHSNLAHNQPDRFGLEDVQDAFTSHPEIALQLVKLFRSRFDPRAVGSADYEALLAATQQTVTDYSTGHRYLDDIRRAIFRCCLSFIRNTLKTNFFVVVKQALSFRIDPAYLAELGPDFTADLPEGTPFRITFFFSRFGFGYHIGFSDIARGGWRTVIARTKDDFVTNSNNLFRENFVLAFTQHLKNKDIYEGGSKMVLILNTADLKARDRDQETWRLYKLQYGVINAFLDIYVTENGIAKNPAVVDYYREEEPIELGPDENMHDSVIEAVARISTKRGYVLGNGIMSSKEVGINHKEYGVTSLGVVTFAEITMAELGIDMRCAPYSVKMTGGPNGDVAGNAMRLLLERSPQVQIRLILDGTAALCDTAGADRDELGRILLSRDLDAFDPCRLNPGGFMLFRSGSRSEGLRELYRKVTRTAAGVEEEWISVDEFSREFAELPFSVEADLFIPGGGRPETIDMHNWERFFLPDGTPSAKVIIEGANSFITPEARQQLQKKGVIIMRDASANKCGVISSSYEIIANLLLTEEEFLANKEAYVADVLQILEKRAADEARLILKRRREQPNLLCTDISNSISGEINTHYARLFKFFQKRPEICLQPLFRRAILSHLPRFLSENSCYNQRIGQLPQKYLFAILAAEIGSAMVYRGDQESDFEEFVKVFLDRNFPGVEA
ncbi:NAD-glutamate dehydrogenase domain-containing protein [Geomonas edaphica]|uniref:NAD-glutamate dehydrogenase domain-containing protein n=1 Tax=Geomonas edaphica TaxID=2570226 RepID=UPI001FE33FC7|nr:NAD-glutamate dehydrogenase domain-containing protein [Geomonas edaphica]